ncbi:MAG: hypothetical protein L0Y76_03855 [Ignavibacteria bacterium]|nr:hypothetical protein [Ignavibacteria bacterium]
MNTALDEYKKYYGVEHDGTAVLKHAEFGHFKDYILNKAIMPDDLRELGITAEMSREQILDCLKGKPGTLDNPGKNVTQLHRYCLQQILDFCSVEIRFDDVPQKGEIKHEPPLTERIHSNIIDPLIDALMRRLYTGKWSKKKKE